MYNIPPNSLWLSSNSDIFKVNMMEVKNDEIWIHYFNINSNKKYNCLIGSFVNRFQKLQTT